MLTTITIGLSVAVMLLLAVCMSYILGWANQAFYVEVDPKVELINNSLPGSNCGGCGFVGCMEYAEAVAKGEAAATLCGPGGVSVAQQLGKIMELDVSDALPYRAVVHCTATSSQRLDKMPYRGEPTCHAANLVSGFQACTYGCLGLGDCVTACDYDAIHIEHGVAVVDYEKCIGCKACAIECPRNIITMVPFKAERVFVVGCCNEDFAADVKKVCKVGCTGCSACTKKNDMLKMEGKLPVIDYEHYDPNFDFASIQEKCKMERLMFIGKPTPEDQEAVAHEDVPGQIRADFKTTVDKSDWWG